MTSEGWQKVKAILNSALELELDARSEYLDEA